MRRIDSYLFSEFLGPFLFGIGAFMAILVGIQLSPWALRLIVRDGYPIDVVMQLFILRLPALVALTLPMAAMFGSLMCITTLSSHGEIIAMRAGGLSFSRISTPILLTGLAISLSALLLNEGIVPLANNTAHRIMLASREKIQVRENFTFQVPTSGVPERVVYVGRFDPAHGEMSDLFVMELRDGKPWEIWAANKAEWGGDQWVLRSVEHTRMTPKGQVKGTIDETRLDIGRSPADLERLGKDLIDMSMGELRQELQKARLLGPTGQKDAVRITQTIYQRLAVPWAALGFALIGAPLGLRPARATTGVGLGISLVVIFCYYVLFNTFNVIGQQGGVPPIVSAWLPNIVLFGAGLFFYLRAGR